MTYRKMPYAGEVECPHCDIQRCWCHLPKSREQESFAKGGTNFLAVYECQACRATWTLGEWHGLFAPAKPPFFAVCTVTVVDERQPEPAQSCGCYHAPEQHSDNRLREGWGACEYCDCKGSQPVEETKGP